MYLFPHASPDMRGSADAGAEGPGRVVGATTMLFREGDSADALFEVVTGVFRATKVFADGRRQVVAFAYPGDVIGFGHGDAYRFDCDALTPGRVQVTAHSDIGQAMRNRPELGEKLLTMAAGEIASMHDLSVLLCRKSAMERIAGFLLSLASRTGKLGNEKRVSLPMCRADIADHLGLTIETVSRNLTKLKIRGIIDLPGRGNFVIRDLERLRGQAECETTVH
ncbi:helix-turn-helix domain-containing protein [Devosia sp. XJ19-1]|uniref:Helix-turn-helix domain-containing protein n=1 Tax=Devosia ureilytica TaxID=2952754 RepID=A0A9Q4AQT5_9HYPH|nr:helix-turn-helix domain-containing protein [Devosia ureilytica]MCP8884463.1 helix-turn-helix domain-containing protein [Devosia ureilytica]MCP8888071.1 helix-turn-helix domain-containing protein [Devosia ureilytica]